MGKSVHGALEWLYNQIFNKQLPTLDLVIVQYRQEREKELLFFSELPHALEQNGFYERGVDYISYYYHKRYPFDQARFLKSEMSISIALSKDISFSGKIDRVDFIDDRLIINDYKTNKIWNENEKDTHKEQLMLYALGLKQKYEGKFKKLFWRLIYLHPGNELEREIFDDDLTAIHKQYLDLCQTIDDHKARFAFGDEETFKPIKWSHCNYCKFQQLCPLWKGMYMEDEEINAGELWVSTIRSAVDDFAKIKSQIAELELKLEWLKSILTEYAQEKKITSLKWNQFALSFRSTSSLSVKAWSLEDLELYLQNKWLYNQTHKIDSFALMRLLQEKILKESEIEWYISKKVTTYPYRPIKVSDFANDVEVEK